MKDLLRSICGLWGKKQYRYIRIIINILLSYHPFGPFAHSDHLSDIFSDAVIRNHLTSKLHAAVHNVRKIIEEVDIFAKVYLSIDDRKLITWEDLLSRAGNKPIELFNTKLLGFLGSVHNHLKLSTGYLQHYE